MNWKRGINRFVWVASILMASFVLLFGSRRLRVEGLIHEPHYRYVQGDPAAKDIFDALAEKAADAAEARATAKTVCLALVAFGFVWLIYGLSIYIYRGLQDGNAIPKSRFWQWVVGCYTGRFPPENDPYRKDDKQMPTPPPPR